MFRDVEFFTELSPVTGNVILGDGKTFVPISGIGVISLVIDGHPISIPDVRFVPALAENIYSLFCHNKQPEHGYMVSFDATPTPIVLEVASNCLRVKHKAAALPPDVLNPSLANIPITLQENSQEMNVKSVQDQEEEEHLPEFPTESDDAEKD